MTSQGWLSNHWTVDLKTSQSTWTSLCSKSVKHCLFGDKDWSEVFQYWLTGKSRLWWFSGTGTWEALLIDTCGLCKNNKDVLPLSDNVNKLSLYSLCMCVVPTCEHTCSHVCACGDQRLTTDVFLNSFPSYILIQGSHWSWAQCFASMREQWVPGTLLLLPPSLGLQVSAAALRFFHGLQGIQFRSLSFQSEYLTTVLSISLVPTII